MDYRQLGASGLKVPALSFGCGTFGGQGPLFSAWGDTDVAQAKRLIDICLEAGAPCSTRPTSIPAALRRAFWAKR